MPNDAMMEQMMSQMQGEAPPMPPPEMMMEQAEGVTMPEGGIGSMNDALQQAASFGRNGDRALHSW